MATSEAGRWGLGSAASAFRQTRRRVARSWLCCQAEIVSVHTVYVSQADLVLMGVYVCVWVLGGGAGGCSWTLRTGFHRLSAAVRLDQKRSGDITWLAINGILAGAKTQSKHAESPSVSVWGDVSHIVSRNPAENANRLGEVIKAPFFSSSFQEVLIWFWLSVNF